MSISLQHLLKIFFTVSLCFTLAACGGGGGGGGGGGDDTNTTASNGSSGSSGSSGGAGEPNSSPKSITLSWEAPTSRQNGDPLLPSEIAGYEIYYFEETSAETDDQIILINSSSTTETTIDELSNGTYFFAIASIDTDGLQSDISDYVETQID